MLMLRNERHMAAKFDLYTEVDEKQLRASSESFVGLSEAIRPVFPKKFPKGYLNNVEGWGISRKYLHGKLPDGTYKLLTLDIDFGSACSLACPHCFRKSKMLDNSRAPLSYTEMLRLMEDAKKLGLQSVKFLGAGEPFENPEFLGFLTELHALGIKPDVFTKGHVIGDDELARKYNRRYGISSGLVLAERLKELNVSILLGFNSFRRNIQEAFVGGERARVRNYVALRDQALLNLVAAGLNEYHGGKATQLAMIVAPIKPENIAEVFTIYKWGRVRNIYTLSCPTTYSGLGINEYKREHKITNFDEYIAALKNLYTRIYLWNIEKGLISLKQFKEEGVSLYPGCHPCNQVAAGMYITLKGKVIACPGRSDAQWEGISDIRTSTLRDVWRNSLGYSLAKQKNKFNFNCIARDGTFFRPSDDFYGDIKGRVLRHCGK